jgi:hypothetical protein
MPHPAMAAKKPGSFSFAAKVLRFEMFYGIDLPAGVSRGIGLRGSVPVVGTVEGTPFRTSLVPVKGGRHRFWLNAELRRMAGVEAGQRVDVVLRVDLDPPKWATPEDLADALRDEGVLEAFEGISQGRRNHLVRWLESAVHETTREKRIARCLELALAEQEKRLDRELRAGTRKEP